MLDLDGWVERVRASSARLMEHFQERFGYPPDSNVVVTSPRSVGFAVDGERHHEADHLSADVRDFFDRVEEVSLPDVWNGYFLGPASRALASHTDRARLWLMMRGRRVEIVVLGSDGGGALYVLAVEDGRVLRVEDAAIRDGVVEVVKDDQVRQLTSSFAGFLEVFVAQLESFAAGTSTPSF